jgi:hypothetical protein
MANPGPNIDNRAIASQVAVTDPDGQVMGYNAQSLISFYGVTPVAQQGGVIQGALNPSQPMGALTTYLTSQSPTIVAANTSGERSFTVAGVLATDCVFAVCKPTAQAGLMVGSARVSAANTVQVTFGNNTSSGITPTGSESYILVTLPASACLSAVLSPAAVAANTVIEQQFTVPGIQKGAVVQVNKPTAQAGLIILDCRAVSDNVVGITFANLTASPITPTASETYLIGQINGGLTALDQLMYYNVLASPSQVAANTSAEQTVTVAGLLANDIIVGVSKPTAQAGLGIVGARVSAANTLALTFVNATGSPITPTASEVYNVCVLRPAAAAPATLYTPTLTPASVAANTTAEQTFTVNGLKSGQPVCIDKPSNYPLGLQIGNARVSADNTLAITFVNTTASAIQPLTETYSVMHFNTPTPTVGMAVGQQLSQGFNLAVLLNAAIRAALVSLGLIAGQ